MNTSQIKETDKYHYSYDTWLLTIKASGHVYKYQPTHYGIRYTPVGFDFPNFNIPAKEAQECGDVHDLMADIDADEIEMRALFTLSEDNTRLDVHASGNWYKIRSFEKGYAFGFNGSDVDEMIMTNGPDDAEKASLYEYCAYLAEVVDPELKHKGGVFTKC